MGNSEAKFRTEVQDLVAEVLGGRAGTEWCNPDDVKDLDCLKSALRREGVESCRLIVGIDFTGSNRTQGKDSFYGESLHKLDSAHGPNPYEQSLAVMGRALAPFDSGPGAVVPAYVFGDVETKHHSVRPLGDRNCRGIDGVLAAYRDAARCPTLSGPTSFAPLIDEAVDIVDAAGGNELHVLLILADGQVDDQLGCAESTRDALVRADRCPLSVVMIGIGDGPWDEMYSFDDELPERRFDNFQFVPFDRFQTLLGQATAARRSVVEAAFAVCALQEVPRQVDAMRRLGLLPARGHSAPSAVPGDSDLHPEGADGARPAKRPRLDHAAPVVASADRPGTLSAVPAPAGAEGGASLAAEQYTSGEAVDALRAALLLLSEQPAESLEPCRRVLLKVLENVVTHPGEAKFRSVQRRSGQLEKVLSCPGGRAFLLAVGFREDLECYSLDSDALMGALEDALKALKLLSSGR